jgi:BTB/POZ domain-containing protein KCTD9
MDIPERKDIRGANLQGADLIEANLEGADLKMSNLERAHLEGAHDLSLDQLSKVKTPDDTKLDEEILISLKEKYPALFEVT